MHNNKMYGIATFFSSVFFLPVMYIWTHGTQINKKNGLFDKKSQNTLNSLKKNYKTDSHLPHVNLQICLPIESLVANLALCDVVFRVSPHMHYEVTVLINNGATKCTYIFLKQISRDMNNDF